MKWDNLTPILLVGLGETGRYRKRSSPRDPVAERTQDPAPTEPGAPLLSLRCGPGSSSGGRGRCVDRDVEGSPKIIVIRGRIVLGIRRPSRISRGSGRSGVGQPGPSSCG